MDTNAMTKNNGATALPDLSDKEKQYIARFEEGIINAYGRAYIPGDFQYHIDQKNGCAEIVRYTGNDKKVNVPAVIEGHLVRKLSKGAFADKDVESAALPSTVTSLGEGLFENCASLKTLYLPGVISTSRSVHDKKLENMKDFVKIASRGETIDFGQLKVDVAYGIKGMYRLKYGLSGKTALDKIIWSKILYGLWDEGRFRPHRTEGIAIPERMLAGCKSLEKIVLSEFVTDIGDEFLAGCNRLREVVLPQKRLPASSGIIRETHRAKAVEDFEVIAQEHETYDFGGQLVDVAYGKKDHYKILYGVSGKIKFDNAVFGDPIPNTFKEGRYRIHMEISEQIPAGMLRQCASLEKIVFPKYITRIGELAFEGCKNLKWIQGTDNLKRIGKNAFRGCGGIRRLVLPDSIQIMENAFADCTALRTVGVSGDCGQIDRKAFEGCGNLTEIILSPKVVAVGREQLLFQEHLDSLVIKGDRVPVLSPQVYGTLRGVSILADPQLFEQIETEYKDKIAYRELLRSSDWQYAERKETDSIEILHYNGSCVCVKIPDIIEGFSVASIGKEAFKDRTDIEEIVLPDPVETIGEHAFSGCSSLTYLVCPPRVKKLGKGAIDGCSSLRALTFLGQEAQCDKSDFCDCRQLKYITIGGKTEGADSKWESRSKFVTEVEDDHVVITDYKGFDDDQVIDEANRRTLVIPEIIDGYPVFQVGKQSSDYDLKGVFAGCEELSGVSFPPSVKMIGTKAFYYCTNLETLLLPERIETLSESCFQECISLVSVNIQAKRLQLGSKAFCGCTRLEEAAIRAEKISAGEGCFAGCTQLKTIYFHSSGGVVFLEDSRDQLCGIEKLVKIPQGETVEAPPFQIRINENEQTVTIQKYIDQVENQTVVIPEYLTGLPVREIADGVFADNKTLRKVEISKTVQRIGRQAFMRCSLIQITLPGELKKLEQEVFSGCGRLEQVAFPPSLKAIGEKAFADCGKLQEIKLPDTMQTIDREAFCGCQKLERIVLGRNLQVIGEGAFSGCIRLRHIMLPQNITVVKKSTFQGCTGLKSVVYLRPDCEKEEDAFLGCSIDQETVCEKIPQERIVQDDMSYRVDAKTGEAVLRGCLAAGSDRIEIPSYINGFPVTSIADIAFLNNQMITRVLIGENIQMINSMAFYGCGNLEEIVFLHKNHGPRVYREAFYALDKSVVYLTSEQCRAVLNEDNCTCPVFCMQGDCREIGIHYTYNREKAELLITAAKGGTEGQREISREKYPWHSVRSKIETVIMEGDIPCVYGSSFEDCRNLKRVVLTEKVERIGRKAFKNCVALSEIVLPENLRYIGEEAFFNCQSMIGTDVHPFPFPIFLQKIDKRAFFGCLGFRYLVFPESVKEIAARAFQRCTQLKEIYMEHAKRPDKIGGKVFYEAAEGCELSVKFADSSMLEGKFDRKVIIHVPIEGECGKEENRIVWKLYYDGLMEIGGSGQMADYGGATPPWNAYAVQIRRIVFQKGITYIGAMAFHSCNVESVEFPDGLESIGQEAFAYCINLSNVKLPSSVVSVGRDCFKGCER